MGIIARGTIADRPWGRTIALVVTRAFTGELAVEVEGKRYVIGWRGGAVVAASSPLAADAVARIAMTAQLINPSQVGDLMRALAAAPGRDEVDALAELVKLTPELAARLRRRAVAARAMRTFAIAAGDFTLDDEPHLPQRPELAIDARAIAYAGVKAYFPDGRLLEELAGLGLAFRLRDEAIADLGQYGFGELERPALQWLRVRPSTPDALEQEFTDLEPKTLRAMLYALACFGATESSGATVGRSRAATGPMAPVGGRTTPPSTPPPVGNAAPAPPAAPPRATRPPSTPPSTRATAAAAPPVIVTGPVVDDRAGDWSEGSSPAIRRRVRSNLRSSAPPVTAADADAIRALVRDRAALMDKGADHFALLGVTNDTTPEHLRSAYFALARQLHPDRLAAAGITDERREAQRLFAQINSAFGILSNPKRRADYMALVNKGGETAIRAEEAEAEALAAKIFGAEEHFRKGEMALRRDQLDVALDEFKQAVALNPAEGEHHALLGWATYCTAPDKSKVRTQVRQLFDEAVKHAPRSVTPYLYLGRIARLEGRDAEAIEHFQRVISTMPGHTEAASELRLLESRRAARPSKPPPDDKPKGGLFGFIKKS